MKGNAKGYINEMKQSDLQHARISMDGRETLEARFIGRVNVVLDVWYYYCANVVYFVHVSRYICLYNFSVPSYDK